MRLKLQSIKPPDQAQGLRFLIYAASYRIALPVTRLVRYPTHGDCYPLCPRCKKSLEREYVSFCDRCGQKLSWDRFDDAKILTAPIIK